MIKMLMILQIISTFSMVGLIWFVQVVHYPMFALVAKANFIEYQRMHQLRTTFVVAPLMLIEAATTIALVYWPSLGMSELQIWGGGVALLLLVWLSTALLQVPMHHALSAGFMMRHHKALVQTNWIRTTAWTCRAFLLLYFIFQSLPG